MGHKALSVPRVGDRRDFVWTVVPFILVILMALPATKVVVMMKDTTNADLTVKVTGMQWKWGYDYIKKEWRRGLASASRSIQCTVQCQTMAAKLADGSPVPR